MALHEKNSISDNLLDDIYASTDLSVSLPKYKFPNNEYNSRNAYQMVHDELMLDGNSRQNLATFCQTWVEPEVHKLMNECIDKNMVDKDEYPQTAELESRCVHMLADLWNSPDTLNTLGCSTTGSSEAAMLGGMALKWKWKEKMRAKGKSIATPNIVTGPVQICWHKFARYFEVEIREIPMEKDRLIMTPDEVLKRCDENTIGVIPTLGVTFTCQYEPVKKVSDALDKLEKNTGLDIPIHVDGASGGFLAPEDLSEDLIFRVNYLGGNIPTFALNFSRPGGQIAAQYYNFLRLGREGYQKIHKRCYETATYIADAIKNIGPFEIIYDGRGGIPALSWCLKEGVDHGFNLFDLSDKIRSRGWQIAAYAMPANREDLVIMRVLVRHGVSRDLGDLLIADIRRCLEYFKDNRVTKSLTEKSSGGYKH